MKRITPLVIVACVLALSSPIVLHAQRGGAGGRGAAGGRGSAPSHGRAMHAPPPTPSTPIPSADHPLPYNFNAVRPAPLLGRDPIPAPFSVPPGYYNRQHPLRSIPYGGYYGYGYAEPGYTETPGQQEVPPPGTAPAAPERVSEPAPIPTPPVVIVPHPPQTMYVIPGCYGGNVPPIKEKLPNGCDIGKFRVLHPPQ